MGRFNCVCEMLASHMHIWSQFWGDAGGIVQVTWEQDKSSKHIFFTELPLHLFSDLSLSLQCIFAVTFPSQVSLWFCVYLNPWRIPSTLVCWTCCKPSENIPNRGEACRIMPREQCWPFLNCEITQAELGMLWKTDVVYTQKHLKCLKGTPGILSH